MNDATTKAARSGVLVAVSSGNSDKDTARFIPGSAAEACATGATNNQDTRASLSNCLFCTKSI